VWRLGSSTSIIGRRRGPTRASLRNGFFLDHTRAELAGVGIEEAHPRVVPLHRQPPAPDPARRRAVVGGLDFDAAIEVDGAGAVPVVAKGLERERAQRRLLLGKHRGDLTLGRAYSTVSTVSFLGFRSACFMRSGLGLRSPRRQGEGRVSMSYESRDHHLALNSESACSGETDSDVASQIGDVFDNNACVIAGLAVEQVSRVPCRTSDRNGMRHVFNRVP
jgi:hypothetical protein